MTPCLEPKNDPVPGTETCPRKLREKVLMPGGGLHRAMFSKPELYGGGLQWISQVLSHHKVSVSAGGGPIAGKQHVARGQ